MLCQLIEYGGSDSDLIKDGVVLTLVQSLQHPVDHPKIADWVYDALKKISIAPDGKAALQSPDVRNAFALAFKQDYPQGYSNIYVWDHAPSIARLIYCDDSRTDLKLSTEVTEIIQTCIGRLSKGLLDPRGPEKMARSVQVLRVLAPVLDYADEITRHDGVPVAVDLIRHMQKQRSDYWLHQAFHQRLLMLCFQCYSETATGALARAHFIMLRGCDLLIEVLGDGTAASRPVTILYAVLSMLRVLCWYADCSTAVKHLPTSSKEIIKRAMDIHAEYLNSVPLGLRDATAKLLDTLQE